MFVPLAWSPDGRLLYRLGVGEQGPLDDGLFAYDVGGEEAARTPFPAIKTLGTRQTRASALGNRFVYRDVDGMHVVDPAPATDRLVSPHPAVGSYTIVACRGTTVCYAARVTETPTSGMRTTARRRRRRET